MAPALSSTTPASASRCSSAVAGSVPDPHSAPGSSRSCGVAAVSFQFRQGSLLFFDHQGQLGSERHLLPLPEAQLLVHNLRLIYGERAVIHLV